MSFFQKIYFSNRPLILASSSECFKDFPHYSQLTGANAANFNEALRLLEQSSTAGVVLYDADKSLIEKELLWNFYPMHSAGGVVINEKQEILMIYRRGKWDLPKGKLDEGESLEECALREVTEETGLKELQTRQQNMQLDAYISDATAIHS
ncbi:MAG: NUDIX domain-containing protein [Chitinophagaceae bacterium]